ncbi:MAG: hypothetical protein JXB23_12040 [Candidatus Aminicenantes bacterium]|nr:hypothetical protein [Candidatus Aminicenantes bacterium]
MYKSTAKMFRICATALFVLSIGLFAMTASAAEEKYAPLVGDYEFDVQGQIMIISFWVEEGKLWGAPEGESGVELEPVEGEDMKFEVNTPNGQFYELQFIKDESGKVTKCIVATMGMEMEGAKIK